MRRAILPPLLALAATSAAVLLGVGSLLGPSGPNPSGPSAQTGTVRSFTEVLDEAQVRAMTAARWDSLGRENAVVVLNSWDYRLVPLLKRANPAVAVWVYKDLSGVRSDDCTTGNGQCGDCPRGVSDASLLSSGMGYCWVRQVHPDWLLRAAGSDRPLGFKGYPDTWETDYGSRAYQRQWAANVLADVRRHGWDGVMVDNALTTAGAYGTAARYRTDAAVQAATYSALRTIGGAFRRARVASVVNVGYATGFPGLWQRWLAPVGGLEQEYYLSYSTRPDAAGAAWAAYEQEVSSCAALRKVCWFHVGGYTAGVTPRTRAYALASLLLATDGQQLLSAGGSPPFPLATRWALGRPRGPMHEVGDAWQRSFAVGVAVVDPSTSGTAVDLGGEYLTTSGHRTSRVVLGPVSGAVWRSAPRRTPAGRAPSAAGTGQRSPHHPRATSARTAARLTYQSFLIGCRMDEGAARRTAGLRAVCPHRY